MASDETKLNAAKGMTDLEKIGVLDASDYANVATALDRLGSQNTSDAKKQEAMAHFQEKYKETRDVGKSFQSAMKLLARTGRGGTNNNKDAPPADEVLDDADSNVSNVIKDFGG